MLKKLAENVDLSEAQIREMHDVIVIGAAIYAIKYSYTEGYIETFPEKFKIDTNIPLFKVKLSDLGQINWKESVEDRILIFGYNILFNRKYQGLFDPKDFNPATPLAQLFHSWVDERLAIYHAQEDGPYSPLNDYPQGNYSQISIYQRLKKEPKSWFFSSPIEKELQQANKKLNSNLSAKPALNLVNQIDKVETAFKNKGATFNLDTPSIARVLNLTLGQVDWLLQGYQVAKQRNIPRDVFLLITSYVLKLSIPQTQKVQQQVCHSLHQNTTFLPFWRRIPMLPQIDKVKDERLEQRLMVKAGDAYKI